MVRCAFSRREADFPAIETAVTAHSAPKGVDRGHEHWPLIALLKDAGLDRVRLGGRLG
jgi:hypothetical protein